VVDVDGGPIVDIERAGAGGQTQIAGSRCRMVMDRCRDGLADQQLLADQALAGGLRGVDVENEIGAGVEEFVLEVYRELDANHEFPKWGRCQFLRKTSGTDGRPGRRRYAAGNVDPAYRRAQSGRRPERQAFTRGKTMICKPFGLTQASYASTSRAAR